MTSMLLNTLGALPDRLVNLGFLAERRRRDIPRAAYQAELAFYAQPAFREDKTFFILPARPAPMHAIDRRPWLDGEQVLYRYPSGYAPRNPSVRERFFAHRENRDGYMLLWRHTSRSPGDAPRPLVLCVHGFRMGHPRRAMAMFKVEKLFRQGMDVALFIQPHHWRRAGPGLRQNFFVAEDLPLTIENIGQQVHDLHASFLALQSMGYRRIGLIGGSLGGLAVTLYATVCGIGADAPAFIFSVVPAIRMDTHLDPARAGFSFTVDEPLREASFRALDIVDPSFYTPRFDLDRLAVVYHRGDRINVARATADWVARWGVKHVTALDGGHWLVFDGKARGKAWYAWLRQQGFCG